MLRNFKIFTLLFLFCTTFSYGEETMICDEINGCQTIKVKSYNNVQFIKYNLQNDTIIIKDKHARMNVKISNIKLNDVKSKSYRIKNKALNERKAISNILEEAQTIDLKRCIYTGYYNCEIYVDGKLLKKI